MITHGGNVFDKDTTYLANLTGHLCFGGLSEPMLCGLYRDGRTISFVVPYAVEHHFSNLVWFSDTSHPTILRDLLTGLRYRVKVITRRGCDLATSNMLGTQRNHKPIEYVDHWRSEIDGWIMVDNRHTPKLVIAAVDKHHVLPPRHVLRHAHWARIARGNNRKVYIQ